MRMQKPMQLNYLKMQLQEVMAQAGAATKATEKKATHVRQSSYPKMHTQQIKHMAEAGSAIEALEEQMTPASSSIFLLMVI